MAWDAKTQIMAAQAVAGTELFSSGVSQTPGESNHVQVVGNSGGTTDSLIISVYASLDDDTENWDTVPLFSFVLDCVNGADNDVSFIVSPGIYRFRVGVVRDGSTDTITTDIWHRGNGVSI